MTDTINILEEQLDKKVKGEVLNEDLRKPFKEIEDRLNKERLPLTDNVARKYIREVIKVFENLIIESMIEVECLNGQAFGELFSKELEHKENLRIMFDDDNFKPKVLSKFIIGHMRSVNLEKQNGNIIAQMDLKTLYCSMLIKTIAQVTVPRNNKFGAFVNVALNFLLKSMVNLTKFTNNEANENIKCAVEFMVGISQEVYNEKEREDISDEDSEGKFKPRNIYKYKDLNKFARDNGFEKVRDNGDHGIFRRFDGSTVIIPQGREIGRGLSRTLQKKIVSKDISVW